MFEIRSVEESEKIDENYCTSGNRFAEKTPTEYEKIESEVENFEEKTKEPKTERATYNATNIFMTYLLLKMDKNGHEETWGSRFLVS